MAEKKIIDTTKPEGQVVAIPGNREVTDATVTHTPIEDVVLPPPGAGELSAIANTTPPPIPNNITVTVPTKEEARAIEAAVVSTPTKTVQVQSRMTSIMHTFAATAFAAFLAYQAATVSTTKKLVPQIQNQISQTQVLATQVKQATQAREVAEAKADKLEAQVPTFPTIESIKKFYFLLKNPDGSYELRTGGSVGWRYNNPGKLLYDNFAKTHKAIGQDGNLAIFASYDDGMAALEAYLFQSDFGYKDKTVEEAIKKYAPSKDGYNPTRYLAYVLAHTKVKANTILSTMNADDRTDFLTALRDYDHWVVGNDTTYASEAELKARQGH